jgi:carnitine-CoA ligase
VLELPFDQQTIPRLLESWLGERGDMTLVRHPGGERTYAEQRDAVARLAGTLAAAGVERGDRVAAMSGNRIELLDLFLACGWLGAILVPLNVASRGAQLDHMLTNAQPKLLVVERERLEQLDYLDALPDSLAARWVLDDDFPGYGAAVAPADVRPGDTLTILYTSGTTGLSKGVICPHAQLYWYGLVTARSLRLRDGDVCYTVLPQFHVNALNTFVQAALVGGTYAFDERFSASRFFSRARDAGATSTYLLGAMVGILLKHEVSADDHAHSIRVALAPGGTAEQALEFERRFGIEVVEGYGSTETSMPFCNRIDGSYWPAKMGKVLPGFEARVVDEDDVEVPPGTPGELVLRADAPFAFAQGYWRMPDRTVEAWRNLWFHSGDRVVRDEDGVYTFLDRLKDAIRRRGENISSLEVEQVLLAHPDVAQASVIPVPSELAEDEVMAVVVLRAGAEPDPEAIVHWCEPRLAYFAIPRYLDFVDELPLTENGKVRKFLLRERGVTPTTWDREAAGMRLSR